MATTVFRNEEKLNSSEVLTQFEKSLEKDNSYSNDIEELVGIFAKNPTDTFIVSATPVKAEVAQGDILLWSTSTESYQKHAKTLSELKKSSSLNLQQGNSVTGDHRIVALKGSTLTIEDGTIKVDFLNGRQYPAKIIKSDKPFLITHREHGNIALPAGTYMSCVALDPASMTRILD